MLIHSCRLGGVSIKHTSFGRKSLLPSTIQSMRGIHEDQFLEPPWMLKPANNRICGSGHLPDFQTRMGASSSHIWRCSETQRACSQKPGWYQNAPWSFRWALLILLKYFFKLSRAFLPHLVMVGIEPGIFHM